MKSRSFPIQPAACPKRVRISGETFCRCHQGRHGPPWALCAETGVLRKGHQYGHSWEKLMGWLDDLWICFDEWDDENWEYWEVMNWWIANLIMNIGKSGWFEWKKYWKLTVKLMKFCKCALWSKPMLLDFMLGRQNSRTGLNIIPRSWLWLGPWNIDTFVGWNSSSHILRLQKMSWWRHSRPTEVVL